MARTANLIVGLFLLPGCAMSGRGRDLADRVVPCPCEIDELADLAAEHPRIVLTKDRGRATSRYHPGAFVTYRVFDPDSDPISGNQCAYDPDGRLITRGPAAGTPDLISPERSLIGHWLIDVLPFRRLGWMEYHQRGWAPVSRAGCE